MKLLWTRDQSDCTNILVSTAPGEYAQFHVYKPGRAPRAGDRCHSEPLLGTVYSTTEVADPRALLMVATELRPTVEPLPFFASYLRYARRCGRGWQYSVKT